jgi:hypothetical protein
MISDRQNRDHSPAAAAADAAFQQAVELRRQGDALQADMLCVEILRGDPQSFNAQHLRGLIAIDRGDPEQGIGHLARSLAINPQQSLAYSNLGNAPRVADNAAHLARLALADLYLDTLPYNAHSTACDALWVGVPVLTCARSRVCQPRGGERAPSGGSAGTRDRESRRLRTLRRGMGGSTGAARRIAGSSAARGSFIAVVRHCSLYARPGSRLPRDAGARPMTRRARAARLPR